MNFSLTMKPIHRKVDRRFASQELLNTTENKTTICMKQFFFSPQIRFISSIHNKFINLFIRKQFFFTFYYSKFFWYIQKTFKPLNYFIFFYFL